MMKKLIDNEMANLYLNAADQLGFSYKILDEQQSLIQIINKDKLLLLQSQKILGLNIQCSADIAKNKALTSQLLKKNNIPVPQFSLFDSALIAKKYALEKLLKNEKFVIKPLDSSNALGITINPSTIKQIHEAIREAFMVSNKILIEETICGNNYRITILDNKIIAVTKRIPAYVIGDGISTVKQLIEQKNIVRNNINFPPIILRKKDLYFLDASNIRLSDIFDVGRTIMLQQGCLFKIGGERVRIDINSIPIINQKLFLRAAKVINLRFAGVDYISPDIKIPYTQIKSAINEVNNSPHPDLHYFDSIPNSNYAAESIIGGIFRKKSIKEKRYLEYYYTHDQADSKFVYSPNNALIN